VHAQHCVVGRRSRNRASRPASSRNCSPSRGQRELSVLVAPAPLAYDGSWGLGARRARDVPETNAYTKPNR
jgi:hypothetical protein